MEDRMMSLEVKLGVVAVSTKRKLINDDITEDENKKARNESVDASNAFNALQENLKAIMNDKNKDWKHKVCSGIVYYLEYDMFTKYCNSTGKKG